ncbi:Uncharacterised protein [Mycolicibacterium flavescens]|nr:Uncharacterised protein [Mycolicibacterium flavescens]
MNQRPRRNPVLLGAAAVLVTALCCAAPVLIAGGALAAVCGLLENPWVIGQPSRCCWRLWSPSPAAVNAAITAVPPTAIHPRRTRSTT